MYIGNVKESNIDWDKVEKDDVFYGCSVEVSDPTSKKDSSKAFNASFQEYYFHQFNKDGLLVRNEDDTIVKMNPNRGLYKTKEEAKEAAFLLFSGMVKAVENLEVE